MIEDKETGNEELRAANEEVQSANEELQSINEELETAKEELQSTNEELVTVNDELSGRNAELGALTDDLSNLFASTDIPIIMVGRDLHVRRLTPAVHGCLRRCVRRARSPACRPRPGARRCPTWRDS